MATFSSKWLPYAGNHTTLTLKCVNFVNFVNFWKEKSHRFRDGIFLFIRSRIYSFPLTLGTPEGLMELREAPLPLL